GALRSHRFQKLRINQSGNITCENCTELDSSLFCEDCSLYYCSQCSSNIHQRGALARHILKNVDRSNTNANLTGGNVWENTALGWFPHPKGKRCMFFNNLLPNLYNSAWTYLPNVTTFRKYFLTEGSRQYNLIRKIETIEERCAYICGDNPSSIGDLLKGSFVRPGDGSRIKFNITNIDKCIEDCSELLNKTKSDDLNLFNENGRTLKKQYSDEPHLFNRNLISRCDNIHKKLNDMKEKAAKLMNKSVLFGQDSKKPERSVQGYETKKQRHSRRKALKRKIERRIQNGHLLIKNICPNLNNCKNRYFIKGMTSLHQINFHLSDIDMTTVDVHQVERLKSVDMTNLVALFECNSGIFNHHTKCLLLEQLQDKVQDAYWQEYDNFYEVNDGSINVVEESVDTDQNTSETSDSD
ncbi:Hypothetical predicted protein, partial [Mytilus galloprovincialis]